MIADSLRAKLTIWYTAVLALVLVSFAGISYAAIASSAEGLEDESVRNAADALGSAISEETLHEEGEPLAGSDPYGLGYADADVAAVVRAFRFGGCQFYVIGPSGKLLATSGVEAAGASIERAKYLMSSARGSRDGMATISDDRAGLRTFALEEPTDSGTYVVVVAHSLADQRERLSDVRRGYMIAVPFALVCAALGGSVLVRKSLGSVSEMAAQAERIEATSLHERLHVPNERDEVGRLARVFNALLARLESSFDRQRRFMADASHELRTPVAIVRGEAEVALSRDDRGAQDYRESLDIIHDEGRRLTTIVDDLFMLARADAGQRRLVVTDVSLDEVVGDSVRAVRSLADRRGVALELDPPVEMPFRGDESLLVRMIVNLLDNAIKYTGPGGEVRIRAEGRDGEYVVTIADTGVGIPESAQGLVFDRFYRVERARPQGATDGSGAGLGLSIALWIARAHGGRVDLVRSDPCGSTFAVSLPVAGVGATS